MDLPPELLAMMSQVQNIAATGDDDAARDQAYNVLEGMLGQLTTPSIPISEFQHQVPNPIPPTTPSLRLTNYAYFVFPSLNTITRARKLIKRGFIHLNGEKVETSRIVKIGDVITIDINGLNQADQENAIVYDCPIPVLYEDDYLAVVNKPAGLVTNGDRKRSLEHALSSNLKKSKQKDALVVPQPVHRLDLMTGGLVCVAKTRSARIQLGAEFEKRNVQKRYRAIVVGYVQEDSGTCTAFVDSKKTSTRWKVVSRTRSYHTDWITTLDLWPKTGRKHQIRIHCASELGHPIVGDKKYTIDKSILCHNKGLFLRALELSFDNIMMKREDSSSSDGKGNGENKDHRDECRLHVEIKEPSKFKRYRESEERLYMKHRPVSSNGDSVTSGGSVAGGGDVTSGGDCTRDVAKNCTSDCTFNESNETQDVLKVWDYLHVNHTLKKSDIILCLGSSDLRVAVYAAELYTKHQLAPKILFSGGIGSGPHSGYNLLGWEKSEAEIMAEEAMRLGVPRKDILIENQSRNTGENITFSYNVLKKLKNDSGMPSSMIIVQKPFMERRAYATFMKQWPQEGNKNRPEIIVTSPPIQWEKYWMEHDGNVKRAQIISIMVGDLSRIKWYGNPEGSTYYQISQKIPTDVWIAGQNLVQRGYNGNLINGRNTL
jgi:23S rRNA pseudouridine1911/1915/1917 synthase